MENAQGLIRLLDFFEDMEAIVQRIEQYRSRCVKERKARNRYIFPNEHELNQGGFLISSADRGNTQFKMQATAGMRLSHLPRILQYFSTFVPGETPDEATQRAPARAFMNSNPRQNRSLGQASIWAKKARQKIAGLYMRARMEYVHRLAPSQLVGAHRKDNPPNPFDSNTENLVGFLTIVLAYLYNLALKAGEALKYWQAFFFRNDFAAMFSTIDATQQRIFHARPEFLVNAVVDTLKEEADLSLTADSPVANKAYVKGENPDQIAAQKHINQPVMQDLTIGLWLSEHSTSRLARWSVPCSPRSSRWTAFLGWTPPRRRRFSPRSGWI